VYVPSWLWRGLWVLLVVFAGGGPVLLAWSGTAGAAPAQNTVSVQPHPVVVGTAATVKYVGDAACTAVSVLYGDGTGGEAGATVGTPAVLSVSHTWAAAGRYVLSARCTDVGSTVAAATVTVDAYVGGTQGVTVTNPQTSVTVSNPQTSVTVSNPQTSVTVQPHATERLKVDAKCEVGVPCVASGAAGSVTVANDDANGIPVRLASGSESNIGVATIGALVAGVAIGSMLLKVLRHYREA
jgi:hypothetical protein